MKDKMMVDMDDVIVRGKFFKLLCTYLGEDINLEDVNVYYLQTLLGDKIDDFWKWIVESNQVDFYSDVPLYEGVYETIDKYKDLIDFYIVTAYIWNDTIDISSDNLKYKYEYLRRMLPMIDSTRYIFTTDKKLLNFDIRLDDKVSNLSQGDLKLLYTAWHNKNVTPEELSLKGIVRVNNWADIDKKLERRIYG